MKLMFIRGLSSRKRNGGNRPRSQKNASSTVLCTMMKTTALRWELVPVESTLWILLSLHMVVLYPSFYTLNVVCGSLLMTFFPPANSSHWRTAGDQGCCMGVTLVPVLLQSMADYKTQFSPYARLASFLWIQVWGPSAIPSVVAAVAAVMDTVLHTQEALWVVFIWNILFYSVQWYPSLHKVFTRGEWTVVTSLASIAATEWICNASTIANHCYVALSGAVGCVVACASTTHVKNTWVRGFLLVLLPLMTVEGALWCQQERFEDIKFPRAAIWLLDFLLTKEEPMSRQYIPSWSRFMWLVYWAVVVAAAILCSPQPETTSVVVVRKFFHVVAIVLFVPVTLAAPQLMALSYTIALCVLIVLESMRSFLPAPLQQFYSRYVDPQKDHQDIMVVSHMALILGCATPLWIYECMESNLPFTLSSLLPLFGILVLGVGDSLAALVGTSLGETKWPSRSITRTLEGSAAMWMGMAVCCYSFPINCWMAAVTFTTLLEAFTMQIDNLVLPLAGAAALLMS